VHLESIVDNIEAFISGELLGHGTVHSIVFLSGLEHAGSMSDHKSTGFEISGHTSELELQVLVRRERSSELFTGLDVVLGDVKTSGSSS